VIAEVPVSTWEASIGPETIAPFTDLPGAPSMYAVAAIDGSGREGVRSEPACGIPAPAEIDNGC
jgi:hypothetical protein